MAVMNSALRSAPPNRRRRVRHKVRTPAYATFSAASQSAMLDLHEIVDISEDGVAIQCNSTLDLGREVNLCLDLAECSDQIYTSGRVVWSNASGRSGLLFSDLPPVALFRLREWLFLNAMAGVANSEVAISAPFAAPDAPHRRNYTDTLAAVTAVQREAEALGPDLAAVLQLVAARAQALVRATGAAVALGDKNPDFMICRASAGNDAPPVGARLQVGSGFSGECVKTGRLLLCGDAELDARVDRESCRALGIRSILAAPVRVGEKSLGLLETFSPQPNTFTEDDGRILQRLAETVLAAVNRAAKAENLPPPGAPTNPQMPPAPGSILFASQPGQEKKMESSDEKLSGISLPRSHLIILLCAFAAIATVLGYTMAPWIQGKLHERGRVRLQTVLASSQAPKSDGSSAASASPNLDTAAAEQLRQMAENGDPAAENALGRRYFQGDENSGIRQNEGEAFHWFVRAAEHGNLAAQAKLALLYSGGRGVPKDTNRAYFWTVLARAGGDPGSKDLATILSSGMTRRQAADIEHDANIWLQQHQPATTKPPAGH
jgi:putative methionine-R-sulfoxide reductase with GAF domain